MHDDRKQTNGSLDPGADGKMDCKGTGGIIEG